VIVVCNAALHNGLARMKSLIQKFLAAIGYRLTKISEFPNSKVAGPSRTIHDTLTQFRRVGFCPATVIDVGVAAGTPELYEMFPDAFHLLIEPLAEFQPSMQQWLHRLRGKAILGAASSREGTIQLNIHPDHLDGSSLYLEQMGAEFDGVPRIVPAITIDAVVAAETLQGPFLIKIDVQGAELDVLQGATRVLATTEVVLLETSLFEFMKAAPQFFDVVSYMKHEGFVVYDIYGDRRRPLDGALGQCDVAFVREDGMFRRDHRYATREQWQTEIAK